MPQDLEIDGGNHRTGGLASARKPTISDARSHRRRNGTPDCRVDSRNHGNVKHDRSKATCNPRNG